MAPRTPETLTEFIKRLTQAIEEERDEVRFGQHHFSHAICMEDGRFRVRRLESTPEEVEAFRKEHGYFMPENLEEISKPGELVHEAENLVNLQAWLTSRWPL